jgi:hypothetical protein
MASLHSAVHLAWICGWKLTPDVHQGSQPDAHQGQDGGMLAIA